MAIRLKYQNQHSDQTLQEGLNEYRQANKGVVEYKNAEESEFFFIPHDICHVIFGCNTSLGDEAITDTWTLFGTDVTLTKFIQFNKLESHKEIMQSVGIWGAVKTFVRSIPRIAKVVVRSFMMKKKWKWDNYNEYMHSKLSDIREEFNIKVT